MARIIIASGPVIIEDHKVLLNRHGEDSFWKFCGGKVEDYNATLLVNARRELQEEMGIDFELLDEKPFLMHVTKETAEGTIDVILVHFLAKKVGIVSPGKDIREWGWFDIGNLSEDLAPNIKPALEHFKDEL